MSRARVYRYFRLKLRGYIWVWSSGGYASPQHQSGRKACQAAVTTVFPRDYGSNSIKGQEAYRLQFHQKRIMPWWVANIVPITKKNGKIRVCIDFRDLNETYPKDEFPLPITDVMIDNTCGFEWMSFMDGFYGYNQIKIYPDDEKYTFFRTPLGVYFYTVMPFGLKNAGATFQRAMNTIFLEHIHKPVECYVDDIAVKSCTKCDHIADLKIIFDIMRAHQLKINPTKSFLG